MHKDWLFLSVHQGKLCAEDSSKVWFQAKVQNPHVFMKSNNNKPVRLANGFGPMIQKILNIELFSKL